LHPDAFLHFTVVVNINNNNAADTTTTTNSTDGKIIPNVQA
jgi:hypothetical protein